MLKATSDDKLVTLINIFTVAPENHDALARLLRQGTEEWTSKTPGFVTSTERVQALAKMESFHLRRQFHRHCWRLNCGARPRATRWKGWKRARSERAFHPAAQR
ncbi:hypothetical protein QTH91_09865 [Variovorax dokdonensis]|uniref:Uncharacterized protein n=1 Tax=Variovorax dokdonensis TaxID=344883 RepID=A0ABT7NA22_9BURK|nr:hypothetical protein [Variovorax dokdonensis]MDM0044788.1 hypothetical protein [Variovorax dokdonensis]